MHASVRVVSQGGQRPPPTLLNPSSCTILDKCRTTSLVVTGSGAYATEWSGRRIATAVGGEALEGVAPERPAAMNTLPPSI